MLTQKWFKGTQDDLSEIYAIRREVFMDEQGLTEEQEFDGTDGDCVHLLICENELPVATGRILIGSFPSEDGNASANRRLSPEHGSDMFKIGRVATVMSHRGRGIATRLMQQLINACVAMGGTRQIIHAQISARGFYEKIGFTAYGEEFDEEGIPHIAMEHCGGAKNCGAGGHCGGCAKGEQQ